VRPDQSVADLLDDLVRHRLLGTGLNAGRVSFQRRDIIDAEVRRLERKQLRRDLKQTRELPGPGADRQEGPAWRGRR